MSTDRSTASRRTAGRSSRRHRPRRKRLSPAEAEKEKAMEALQAGHVAGKNLQCHQCHSKHEFSGGQHGYDTKHAHKLPGCTQERCAHGVHRSDRSLRENPTSTRVPQHGQRKPRRRGDANGNVHHSEKPATGQENSRTDAAVDSAAAAAAAGIRHECVTLCISHPPSGT